MELVLLTDGGAESQQLEQTCVHSGKAGHTAWTTLVAAPYTNTQTLERKRNQRWLLPDRRKNVLVRTLR